MTAPTSALTEGPGPAPGGGEALSESNRSENYRLLRISLREGSVVVRGLQVTSTAAGVNLKYLAKPRLLAEVLGRPLTTRSKGRAHLIYVKGVGSK